MRLLNILILMTVPVMGLATPIPNKMMNQIVESHCQNLAHMTLHPDTVTNIIVHTEAKVVRDTAKGMYVIVVAYKYRKGRTFACVFQDYRSGRGSVRLLEVGLYDRKKPVEFIKIPDMQEW